MTTRTTALGTFRQARDFGRTWARDRHADTPGYSAFLIEHVHHGAALPILGLNEPTAESEALAHFICRVARREFLRLAAVAPETR